MATALEYSLGYLMSDLFSRVSSPYALGPLYRNALAPIVERLDFDRVCSTNGLPLFICATNVRTGKIKVFQGDEITTEAMLVSACLPSLFQAVATKTILVAYVLDTLKKQVGRQPKPFFARILTSWEW